MRSRCAKRSPSKMKSDLGLPNLAVEWVPVTGEDQFRAVQENKVDLLCGAAETLPAERMSISRSQFSRVGSEHFSVQTLPPD